MTPRPPTAIEPNACDDRCSSREGETASPRCPISRTVGHQVDLVTVKALLKGSALRLLNGSAYSFCPDPSCDVVYFDRTSSQTFRKSDVVVRVGQKESEDPIPVCYCFDFSVGDLRKDIATRGDTDIPTQITAEVRAGHCACEVKNPQGSCCLGNVWSAVKRIRSEISSGIQPVDPSVRPDVRRKPIVKQVVPPASTSE